MKQLSDFKLANQLEELRINHPNTYLHIKGTTDSITRRLAIQELETAFAEMQENLKVGYDVFIAHPDAEEALAWYLSHEKLDFHQIYVLEHPNRSHAGCFLVDTRDKIVGRRFLLEAHKVDNLMQTFNGHLLLFKQAWIFENDGMDNALDFSDMF